MKKKLTTKKPQKKRTAEEHKKYTRKLGEEMVAGLNRAGTKEGWN